MAFTLRSKIQTENELEVRTMHDTTKEKFYGILDCVTDPEVLGYRRTMYQRVNTVNILLKFKEKSRVVRKRLADQRIHNVHFTFIDTDEPWYIVLANTQYHRSRDTDDQWKRRMNKKVRKYATWLRTYKHKKLRDASRAIA